MAEIEFSELGLTKNEGKAYEALVKFGKLSASEVSKHSGVSYSRIYDVLDSLADKGLVEVVPEKTKKFVPTDPALLLKLVEEKEKALEKTRAKIKEMKRFYEVKEKNPVVMGVGRKAFYKIVEEMREAKKLSYSIKYTSEYRPNWERDVKKNLRKGTDMKVLTRYDEETKKSVEKWLKIYKTIKKFDNEGVAIAGSAGREGTEGPA